MLTDAGSIPAASTNHLGSARPLQPTAHADSGAPFSFSEPVSGGLKRSLEGHKSGTFGTDLSQPKSLPFVEKACQATESFGTVECRTFRKDIFSRHGILASALSSKYVEMAESSSYVEANRALGDIDSRLMVDNLRLSSSLDELKSFAEEISSHCKRVAASLGDDLAAYRSCSQIAGQYKIDPPPIKKHGLKPSVNRMGCSKWWRRKLFTLQRRVMESVARDLGLVHKHRSAYCSLLGQDARSNQKAQIEQYLSTTYLVNDQNEVHCLKDLHDSSVSNPAIRRAELMTRISGFEMVAEQLGHVGEFYTLTAPSRMHARLSRSGKENPRYDGTTPYEANQHLQKVWARIRAQLSRDEIYVYGFRVAEPNHDGTPHWHMILFMSLNERERVREVMQAHALREDGNEPGAKKYRFKAVAIDPERGTAAGYIAKYISKNIDGFGLEDDAIGNDAKSAANAVDAWKSRWSIRQFQQIGGPSVTVWRELRRLASLENRQQTNLCGASDVLREAVNSCTASDWAAYVMIMGGPRMRKVDRPIKPMFEELNVCEETGEIDSSMFTSYGDFAGARIKGLRTSDFNVFTRTALWTIVEKPELHPD